MVPLNAYDPETIVALAKYMRPFQKIISDRANAVLGITGIDMAGTLAAAAST